MGTGTGVEVNEGAQDGNWNGSGNGDEEDGHEDRTGEGGRDAKKRTKPQNSCRRHVQKGETWWK